MFRLGWGRDLTRFGPQLLPINLFGVGAMGPRATRRWLRTHVAVWHGVPPDRGYRLLDSSKGDDIRDCQNAHSAGECPCTDGFSLPKPCSDSFPLFVKARFSFRVEEALHNGGEIPVSGPKNVEGSKNCHQEQEPAAAHKKQRGPTDIAAHFVEVIEREHKEGRTGGDDEVLEPFSPLEESIC